MNSNKEKLKVVMFPWLAHGHITPFLELAKRLSDKNFHIYLCSTPINLSSIKNKIPKKYSISIQLLELHLPSSPELPPHYHTTNGLPLKLHPALRISLKTAKPNFSNLLKTLKPDLLIHDVILQWAGSLASSLNIPAVSFFTSGATMFSYFCHLGRHPGVEFPFPAIRLTNIELSMVRKNMESAQKEQEDKEDEGTQRTNGIILVNSSREIEGKYMDYLSVLINRTIIPVGSLVQDSSVVPDHDDDDDDEDADEIMAWLDEKYELSSVFVSFGSEYFLKKDEIEEIAYGLELSNVNFIWIIRFPKGEEMKLAEVLPKGYLDRIGNRGKVVIKWSPQGKILMHSSIGAFVSHCGWNSLMESIEFGVPIVAMPMHLDQPMNAKLVVEIGVGVEVRRHEEGKIEREEICKVIKDVVFGENGQVLRKRIGEMREIIRFKSRKEIEEVVEKLVQVCGKSFDANSYNHGRNEEENV